MSQLLTESLLLSAAGGAAGLLLATWLTDLFGQWNPPVDIPIIPAVSVDLRVMLFAHCGIAGDGNPVWSRAGVAVYAS